MQNQRSRAGAHRADDLRAHPRRGSRRRSSGTATLSVLSPRALRRASTKGLLSQRGSGSEKGSERSEEPEEEEYEVLYEGSPLVELCHEA